MQDNNTNPNESKLGYYLRVLGGASFKKFFATIDKGHNKSGKSKPSLFFDMLWCMARYGAGYNDYVDFEFWNLSGKQRDTYLTRLRSKKLISYMNDQSYNHIFANKAEFNRVFKDYIGREFVDMETATDDDIRKFYEGRDKYFLKMLDLSCGDGAELKHKEDFKDADDFVKYVREKGFGTLEDVIENHPDVARLYPHSVNTMRMITLLGPDKVPHVLIAVFKMGINGRIVDNFGLHSPVDLETGAILYPCHSGDITAGIHYTEHPNTHVPLIGYRIPFVPEACEMVKRASLVIPQVRYVGWDVAITPNGPVIIEGNEYTAHDFWQLPGQTPGGIGILPTIHEIDPDFKW